MTDTDRGVRVHTSVCDQEPLLSARGVSRIAVAGSVSERADAPAESEAAERTATNCARQPLGRIRPIGPRSRWCTECGTRAALCHEGVGERTGRARLEVSRPEEPEAAGQGRQFPETCGRNRGTASGRSCQLSCSRRIPQRLIGGSSSLAAERHGGEDDPRWGREALGWAPEAVLQDRVYGDLDLHEEQGNAEVPVISFSRPGAGQKSLTGRYCF